MIIGLTGGIGSGKTTVAKIFKHLKVPVYMADDAAKVLLDTDENLKEKLTALLGSEILENNRINKPKMAAIIFSSEELLNKANALIHPAVAEDFKKWHYAQHAPYVIREAAILYESGSYKDCNAVISVTAPEEMRIKRVMDRNGTGREDVLARMKHQWPQEQKDNMADYIITNDQSISIIEQVIRIHENILGKAKQGTR